jgi:hypothetical protein
VHVCRGIHLDKERDGGDHHEHHRGQAVDVLPDLQVKEPGLEVPEARPDGLAPTDEVEQDEDRHDQAGAHGHDADGRALARRALAEEKDQEEGHHRERGNQPGVADHGRLDEVIPVRVVTISGG